MCLNATFFCHTCILSIVGLAVSFHNFSLPPFFFFLLFSPKFVLPLSVLELIHHISILIVLVLHLKNFVCLRSLSSICGECATLRRDFLNT